MKITGVETYWTQIPSTWAATHIRRRHLLAVDEHGLVTNPHRSDIDGGNADNAGHRPDKRGGTIAILTSFELMFYICS